MEKRQLTPDLPTYEVGRRFLQIIDGVNEYQYTTMVKAIYEYIRSPKDPFNWKEPEDWIPRLLEGECQDLALRLWRKSNHNVNPRHTFGPYNLCRIHQLTSMHDGVIQITERGKRFVSGNDVVLAEMDDYDGLLFVLSEVAAKGPGRRRDFEGSYGEFCRMNTTYAADSSISTSLISRLNNLVNRSLIQKGGHSYQVTHMGLEYLGRYGSKANKDAPNPAIAKFASASHKSARQQLAEFLQSMNPYQFEHLVKLLLENLGYDNVEVTAASNDKGVDVVADIELGISRVREMVQVKRQKGNIGQPIISQLRGALPLFDAVRGSIVTTGGFSKKAQEIAFVPNAAPITLIDGERLLDLLIEHDIGIRRHEIRILEFDGESLSQFETEDDINI